MTLSQLIGVVVVVAFAGLMALFTIHARRGVSYRLRPLPAYDLLSRQAGQAVETGQRLHLSLGTGGLGGADTAASLAALPILNLVASATTIRDAPPIVTIADPTLLPVALDAVRRAERRSRAPTHHQDAAMLIAPRPLAYAAGAAAVLRDQAPFANVAVGPFGPELVLLTLAAKEAGLVQVAGAADPLGQALATVTTTSPGLVGEEIFAGGAYLCHQPAHIASLRTQDVWRILLIGTMLVGVVLRTVGIL